MPRPLPDLLHRCAHSHSEAPALVHDGKTLTHRELDARTRGVALGLRDAGLRRGDRLALMLSPGPDFVAMLWACLRLGVVACPLSPRLPAARLSDVLHRLQSRHLVVDEPVDVGSDVQRLMPDALGAADAPSSQRPRVSIDADQPATLLFTSGSTGTPCLALHSYGNHYYSALGSNYNVPLALDDRWLVSLPLFHVGGLAILFRCLLSGAAVVLPGEDAIHEALRRHRVTHASLVPTQLRRLLADAPRGALDPLRAVLLGGGPIPESLVSEAVDRRVPLHTTYGLTEMSSQVTTTAPTSAREQLSTAGRLLPYRQLALADDGEILVRGRTLFLGYVHADGLHRPVDEAGWFHTGDLGELTREGCLRILGRIDNLFISGGENVHPEEIEQALARLPGVREAVVVAVPDEEYGARPVAFVRSAADVTLSAARWRAALERELPRFKIPDAFHPWPSDSGVAGLKPDRQALQQTARELQRGKQ